MKIEIKHRITGRVLFSLETESLKLCVEAAVRSIADLRGAYLRGCLLYTSDAADELLCVDLGGRRII